MLFEFPQLFSSSKVESLLTFTKGNWILSLGLRDEWIKKKWYIHTMEYYVLIKRNENVL